MTNRSTQRFHALLATFDSKTTARRADDCATTRVMETFWKPRNTGSHASVIDLAAYRLSR
jgi:hypothetical protein